LPFRVRMKTIFHRLSKGDETLLTGSICGSTSS
jgi:hypothetical protein